MNKSARSCLRAWVKPVDHAEDRANSVRVHEVEAPDVRAIRRKLYLSRQEFAQKCRICADVTKLRAGRRQQD
jgi:DNA-binding transcriptional regulator YiaG